MSWAELRGYIELSPFRMWKLNQPKLPAQRGFGAAEVRRMVDLAARQLANPLRDTAILLLLFDTGIRRSEICRMNLADVIEGDHMASSVTVHGKGDKYRRIEIHPQTQRAIFDYLVNERPQKVRCEALFLGRGARGQRGYHPLTVDGASQLVERIARRAGLEGARLGPHSLRHGFTHEYLESDGARIEDLQILLGHESIAISPPQPASFTTTTGGPSVPMVCRTRALDRNRADAALCSITFVMEVCANGMYARTRISHQNGSYGAS